MSLHAAGHAVRAAAHEAHVSSATVTTSSWYISGCRRSHTARTNANGRAKRSTSPTTAYAAVSSPQHLPNWCGRRRTSPSLSHNGSTTPTVLLVFNAEPPESNTVAGLSEESVVWDLFGWHLCRLAESHHGDAVDRLVLGYDSPHTDTGVDRETSSTTANYYAVSEEYTSTKASAPNGYCACGSIPSDKFGHATSSSVVRELHSAEATSADATELPSCTETPVSHTSRYTDSYDSHRPHYGTTKLCYHDAGSSGTARDASCSTPAVRQPSGQHDYGQFPPLPVT